MAERRYCNEFLLLLFSCRLGFRVVAAKFLHCRSWDLNRANGATISTDVPCGLTDQGRQSAAAIAIQGTKMMFVS